MAERPIDALVSGDDNELRVCVDYFNSIGQQIELLIEDLANFTCEVTDAPKLAEKAKRDAKQRAAWVWNLLSGYTSFAVIYSAEVMDRLEPAISGMLDATAKIANAETEEAFEGGIDTFAAVSPRYQKETKDAGRLICAVIEKRRRDGAKQRASTEPGKFLLSELREITRLKNTALSKYTGLAKVPKTTRGGRNRQFTTTEVRSILNAIVKHSSIKYHKQRAEHALKGIAEVGRIGG